MGLGVGLRLRLLLSGRSLWLDEAALALSIRDLGPWSLISSALDYQQGAPAGFLLLVKLCSTLLGPSDVALRLVPFLLSVGTLVASVPLATCAFATPLARCVFVALMAFSPQLLYYSTELKQFIGDVFFAVLLPVLGLRYARGESGRAPLALVGIVAPWASHAAALLLAALGALLTLGDLSRRRFAALRRLAGVIALWLTSFGVMVAISLHTLLRNPYLVEYWRAGYAPLDPTSAATYGWYADTARTMVRMAFLHAAAIGPSFPLPARGGLDLSLLAITCSGAIALTVRAPWLAAYAALALLLPWAASALELYPFAARLVLFSIPLVFLACTALVDALASAPRVWSRAMAAGIALGLVACAAPPALESALHPRDESDIKGALAFVREHRAAGDQIAISRWSRPAYHFYREELGLGDLPLVAVIGKDNDARRLIREVARQGARGRTWVLYSHRFAERRSLLRRLRATFPELASWEGRGAGAYLFDFSRSSAERRAAQEAAPAAAALPH